MTISFAAVSAIAGGCFLGIRDEQRDDGRFSVCCAARVFVISVVVNTLES